MEGTFMQEILQDKYMVVYLPSHHLAKKDGYVYVHRLVAEKILGRPLEEGETVHHKDENKLNNSPDNLMIFRSNADHSAFHKGYKAICANKVWYCPDLESGVRKVAKKYSTSKKSYKYFKILCPKCHKNYMAYSSKMCDQCRKEQLKEEFENNQNRPTKDELLNLIMNYPFVKIGKMFGVSDNAVRRWCKKYELPFKRKEINEYKKQNVGI